MDDTMTIEQVKAEIAKHIVQDNPNIEILGNYYENDVAPPIIGGSRWGAYPVVRLFTSYLSHSHSDKIIDLLFSKTNVNNHQLITDFFAYSENYNHLLINAYHRALADGFSSFQYFNLALHSFKYARPSLTLKSTNKSEQSSRVSKDDMNPFGIFLSELEKDEIHTFIDAAFLDENSLNRLKTASKPWVHQFDITNSEASALYEPLNLLHNYYPKIVSQYFHKIITYPKWLKNRLKQAILRSNVILRLLHIDPKTYEPLIAKQLNQITYNYGARAEEYEILEALYAYKPKTYKTQFLTFIHHFLDYLTVPEKSPFSTHTLTRRDIPTISKYVENSWLDTSLIQLCFEHLKKISPQDFEQRIIEFCKLSQFLPIEIIPIVKAHFGAKSMPIIADIFRHPNYDSASEYFQTLIESIDDLNWAAEIETIWKLSTEVAFRNQAHAAKILAKKPDKIMPFIKKGLAKAKGHRLLSYLILARMDSKEASNMLWEYFHNEPDEYVRDNILPIITRKFYQKEFSIAEVNALITSANKRGAKTKASILKKIPLPDLYFKNGKTLSTAQVEFLIYRMSQIRVMQSDPEARLLIQNIDRRPSTDFAKAILEAFLEKGAPAKQKYIMCLAGILGDESLLSYLQKLFKELHDGNRLKMAQYVIATIAMVGTDKALRFVEFVSRKYKRKASIEAAAIEALENAAEELGMDIYELSDRIIPDFGFDGLFKSIEINDEEIRVFVGKDFKLQFITEDNKVRKSVPKAADKAIKDELKLIQKEIREVNKAQRDRLEQYMVMERKWSIADWQQFYLRNPVMFIYASTLLWGIFDDKNNLKSLFYVDEDASILDIEDDELDLENGQIGIVHPLRISSKQKSAWVNKFYENNIIQPFKQLDRGSFKIHEEEKERDSLERFKGKKPERGSSAVKGFLERHGWRKSPTDGGALDFIKYFKAEGVRAILYLDGVMAYYEPMDVELYNVEFKPLDSYEKIKLKEISEIAFSEVISDLEGLIII